jgi:hypothetical protein
VTADDRASEDAAQFVQVGRIEVEPAVLEGPGAALVALLANREIEDWPDEWPADLPRDGWRLVQARPARALVGPQEILAAPSPGNAGGFALIYLSGRDGRWGFAWDEGPLPVNPGKLVRRAGLELAWRRDVVRARMGQPWELTADLVNTSWRHWHNVAADGDHVTGKLGDEAGNRLVGSGSVSYFYAHQPLPCLRPHEVIKLPVTILEPNIDRLDAGRYTVQATLNDLGLRSGQATLILTS